MWPFSRKKKDAPSGLTPQQGVQRPVIEALAPWRARHQRRAWRPIITNRRGRSRKSHYGGIPLVGPNAPLPICARCGRPPALFLQLDSRDLPPQGPQFGSGIFQLFYCTRCDYNDVGQGWDAFSVDSQMRVIEDREIEPARGELENVMAPKFIVGWEEFSDSPHPEDFDDLGLHLDYDFDAETICVRCPELAVDMSNLPMHEVDEDDNELAEAISLAASGDKLGGWPYWVQASDYPSCPQCGTAMDLFFQIDSNCGIDFMFGDAGCSHITQCPNHKDVFAFAWACS